ncbi:MULTISPECIES: glycoside hydrolase family 2 TIM barrel-domain containing protein [Tenacibaculum]|uniref:glycoside hydrolase family 2 TIM barrel-domain containing protein n=1 Tax=Tenacibaculum TaxID=104267 RepID=UPI001F0A7358|nr:MULTISPECIES: glycoside hydrolase family 2 TIM barrel-domain containing protein [Tenacibaculum]MCH3882013.1 hypothetical protein [Tenacibaculum aquimarinum]MDO6601064.1 glycoside hydrolase family 2 TIM barrel-domain containing protein [Tenacibaculum sp. 1_MG-2023]
MKNSIFYTLLILFLIVGACNTSTDKIFIEETKRGFKLKVNNKDFFINGMNWDYFPIGTNYEYSLWNQSDETIKKALDSEMSLLKEMGVNAIRQYTGVPPKWIKYIYKNYGIYTMLNHSFGRYGLTIDGKLMENTQYGDSRVEKLLVSEVKELANNYKNTPGLLMYLLGNENNYGLFWEGAETKNIPSEDKTSEKLATALYKLFNKAAIEMKTIDKNHPVAMCNGDLMFIDIIAKECKDVDVFGTNVYRGISFRDAFEEVKKQLNKPILFTEFGADAFNALNKTEDEEDQAYYLKGNWKEIYENAAGLGNSENCIGGFTFQFSDGWWKYGQTKNLNVHDTNASWANKGYAKDFLPEVNNMNEEWFGICEKGQTNKEGLYSLKPRVAYYVLKEVHQFYPYADDANQTSINEYFKNINMAEAVNK